jgi:hypothetical protein
MRKKLLYKVKQSDMRLIRNKRGDVITARIRGGACYVLPGRSVMEKLTVAQLRAKHGKTKKKIAWFATLIKKICVEVRQWLLDWYLRLVVKALVRPITNLTIWIWDFPGKSNAKLHRTDLGRQK